MSWSIDASSGAHYAGEKDDVVSQEDGEQERMMMHGCRKLEDRRETSRRSEQRRRHVIVRQTTPRDAEENASVEGRNILGDRPRAGQLIQQALEQGAERADGNGGGEAWERTCAAQRMTPQRSPFQADQAGSGVAVHGPLLRCQMPYLRFVVTTGAQAARRPPSPNGGLPRNEAAEEIEDCGRCARVQDSPANGGD